MKNINFTSTAYSYMASYDDTIYEIHVFWSFADKWCYTVDKDGEPFIRSSEYFDGCMAAVRAAKAHLQTRVDAKIT
jgi:hypothetical protein